MNGGAILTSTTPPLVRRATASDLETIEALLRAAQLPPDGIADQFPDGYSVAEADGRIVGAAGIERYGDAVS
jgi:N-acetylglutamate synthase-like GNAT family acetyltransferase